MERKYVQVVIHLTWEAAVDKTAFLLVHMTLFELPLVLLLTALAARRLFIVLEKHDARQKEANLARKVAIFYLTLMITVLIAAQVLG